MAKEQSLSSPSRSWQGRFGFYTASMGTAIGLGNLWRFPYVVSDYGGGAFVFLYVLLAIFIGVPLVISEISIGKILHNKGTSLCKLMEKKGLNETYFAKIALWFPILISFLVFSYYCVLSGWTLHLIVRSGTSLLLGNPFRGELSFLNLKQSAVLQVLLLSVHLILVFFICVGAVKAEIKKWLSFVIPFFVVYLIYISFTVLSGADLVKAAKYMIYPNFHMLSPKSFSYALGHVLFTMSIGFCAFISLGSQLPKEDPSGTAGVRVALIDTSMSLFLGFIIFPVVIIADYKGKMSEALFRAFPNFAEAEGLGTLVSLGFYVCIFIAAINASLALVDSILYRFSETLKWNRIKSAVCVFLSTFLCASSIIFLNQNWFVVGGFIEKVDDIVINVLLPFSAIVLSYVTLKVVDETFLEHEFLTDLSKENVLIYKGWRLFLKYIMPFFFVFSLFLRQF